MGANKAADVLESICAWWGEIAGLIMPPMAPAGEE